MILIDFETYFDSEYSLSKMPAPEYLRDPRFRVLGCAVQRLGGAPEWLEPDQVRDYLHGCGARVAVAHNAAFDASVAWAVYGWAPALWLDTMLLARYAVAQGTLPHGLRSGLAALGAHYGMAKGDTAAAVAAGGRALAAYALNDLAITARVLNALLPGTPGEELHLMDLHVRMQSEPRLRLDDALLRELVKGEQVPEAVAVACRSRPTFVRLLEARGVRVPTKTTPRGREAPALARTDRFMRELPEHPDPVVRALARVRLSVASTIRQSRAQRLLAVGAPLPVPLLYYGAHTGRSSGNEKLNLQNLPRGGGLRHALLAPPGYQIVSVDSAQVEVRVLAWLAGCEPLLSVFRAGADPYRDFGSRRYGKPPGEVTDLERRVSKAAVLALGFGQGTNGFLAYCARADVPLGGQDEAQAVVATYRAAYPEIPRLWQQCEANVLRTARQVLPSGRVLIYPELRREGREVLYTKPAIFSKRRDGDTVKIWGGLAAENLVQAVARDVVLWQALQLSKKYKVVLLVHDECVMVVPESEVAASMAAAEEAFARVPAWASGLPVAGKAKSGLHYT